MAEGGTTANKNSWETFNGPQMLYVHIKTFIMQKCKCKMLPALCTGSILYPHPIFVQIFYILHFVSLVLWWEAKVESSVGGWQISNKKLRFILINGRKWSESEKPRPPTPRTFGEVKKGSWVSPPYMEWEVKWILGGKYLLRMLKCSISAILLVMVFFALISGDFSNNDNNEVSHRLSMSHATA